ncbi:molybdopterin-containing oxidoreductase family protein [Bailinhaonella thermotolerans]|uniref:Molybdopterin oxidoreductase family protein n=1 Tax=Bailinhaonella thermotolerans TaxID=1070861 RepID=A0A3A4AQR8_9ACTN|nr:molybdopterin oxidoreductase family protein [Bailinhaonella thermotolerans]RJL30949.1 molybdopterin oxidoreductase family protein [Bailinhaonella thermotolerans]
MSSELNVIGACPLDCPDGCSWTVTVKDGVATRLRGNPDHPYTRGALCVKVNRWLEHAAAEDRILYPMRRVGAKGEGRFERITWDEALDEIAVRLRAIIDEHGGEAIWPYFGTGTLGFIQGEGSYAGRALWNVLGASHHDLNICSAAGNTGIRQAMGNPGGLDPQDLAHSRLILLWGTNTLTSGHHLWKFIQDADRAGAHIVAIDPIRTRTADRAHEHLAPLPGTDAALALGLMHIVVRQGAHDREFIENHTEGWDRFAERLAEFTPARTAAITGLPEERVVALGERLAETRPTAIRATMGVQRHAGGGAAMRALACIPAVTGDWRHRGGGLSYSTSGHFPLNTGAVMRDDLLERPVRTLAMTRLAEGLLDLSDPPVKALIVTAANPVASTSDQNRIRAGLSREDLFTVVMEQFPTDTVDYADIVLPATMQHEHTDLNNGYGHLYLNWNEPAVPPPGECLSTTETFRRLARRLGLTEPALYRTDEEIAELLLSSRHRALEGITVERLRKEGFVRLSLPEPFLPYAEGFPTDTGRLKFVSEDAAARGLDPVVGYTPPAEALDTASPYPFAMITPASHTFLNTVFGNNPELRRRAKGPRVMVHPDDAAAKGLADGQRVRVFNARGGFEAEVEITDRVRPGVVASPKGHWPKLTGGANVNATVDERDADLARGPLYHDNRVDLAAI